MAPMLTIVTDTVERDTLHAEPEHIWRECPMTPDTMFEAVDEAGRAGWFVRVCVSGLYPRRIGPYRTEHRAREVFEAFVARIKTEAFGDLRNNLDDDQAYVVEAVPILKGQ